jgi:hypothetical protein
VSHIGLGKIANDNGRRQLALGAHPLQGCNELVRIHITQLHVQDQHIRPRAGPRRTHDSNELLAAFRHLGIPPERTRHGDEAVGCIAARVRNKHFQAMSASRGIRVVGDSKRHLNPERAAFPDDAGDTDFTSHQFNEPSRNR